VHRGVARNLFRRGTKWGQKSPSGVQGHNPGGGMEVKLSEAEYIYANDRCNNVLTKTPNFSAWRFLGGHVPLAPPFPTPLVVHLGTKMN